MLETVLIVDTETLVHQAISEVVYSSSGVVVLCCFGMFVMRGKFTSKLFSGGKIIDALCPR